MAGGSLSVGGFSICDDLQCGEEKTKIFDKTDRKSKL
jgi:hypothetical protein